MRDRRPGGAAPEPEISPVGQRSLSGEGVPPAGPEISVVVPTYNRSQLLGRCLESLDHQTVAAQEYEVIVVVDGSTDGTLELLATIEPRYALTVLETPRSGASAARNAGAARAAGRVILFLDDDEEADTGLISAHLNIHRTRTGVICFGAITRRVPDGADRFARLAAQVGNEWMGELPSRPVTYWDCCGGNMSLERSAFQRSGGFATDLARLEDTELAYRLSGMGLETVFVADAVAFELRTRGWRSFLADAELGGRIAIDLYRRHPPTITGQLGRYGDLPRTRVGYVVFALALRLRLPPFLLALIGFALPRPGWTRAWFFSIMLNHAYWRGVRAAAGRDLWRRIRSATVILCYHAFSAGDEPASRYVVAARRFKRQLAWLGRRGYHVISLREYVACLSSYQLPPPKTVVITMDDGYADNVTVAGPILDRHGFIATVFAVSAPEEQGRHRSSPTLLDRPLIDPDRIAALLDGPFELGAHAHAPRSHEHSRRRRAGGDRGLQA
jgi:glycosyltransferase involved in cell wall biosynthesis